MIIDNVLWEPMMLNGYHNPYEQYQVILDTTRVNIVFDDLTKPFACDVVIELAL